ncbi:MAG: HAD-IC family P-type ATPase [bacterium]|nr:HAD-IC family P-type ATPase [bacterium]
MKHIRNIIFRNFISPISIAIFVLAAGLFYLGELRDAWFISVVILVNSTIGSIQEIRAYLTLKKIELLSAPRARVFRGENIEEVLFNELQVGDKIQLKTGDEVPADAKILSANSFEIDEAILTGESLAIKKIKNSEILAGSIVVSGDAVAEVTAVGEDTKSGQMTKKLKTYKPNLTPIQQNISKLISGMTYFAIFLAIAVIWRYAHLGNSQVEILKTITSAAIVVVPEGLLLASSLLFAYGSLRLLQAKVLPQKISAIEDMALLQILATDKTGTLTSPEIIFEGLENLSDETDETLRKFLVELNSQSQEKNATAQAILAEFGDGKTGLKIIDAMAFSSARKLSGLTVSGNDTERSVVFGAPEFILKNCVDQKISQQISERVNALAEKGLRVLLLAKFQKTGKISELLKTEKLQPLAIVTLKNSLRQNVSEAVDFLQKRGVSLRVISGDNPRTVSFIAKEAGILNPDKFITGAELNEMSEEGFEKAVMENTIFARVLPEQKEKIISIFQKNKLYTGMIGDGVNDALAIKKADLGISMFDAAPATRRVADLVLMDNSFTSLPSGVKIGDRIMLAIEMIAVLFFHKIILGLTILFVSLSLGIDYPFLPRHITYMNFILVTLPTILTTLFPPIPVGKINPHNFWRDTLYNIAPIAVLSGFAVSMIYVVMISDLENPSLNQIRGVLATVVVVAAYFGVFVTILGEKMLSSKLIRNTIYRRALYILVTVLFTGAVFGSRLLRDFFEFNFPSIEKIWFVASVVMVVSIVQFVMMKKAQQKD